MAKRKAAKRAPEPVDETTEEYWDEEESSTSTSELSWSDPTDDGADGSSDTSTSGSTGAAADYFRRQRQRRMKTVKPKPLRTLMGNDLSKPRKRKITLIKE